MESIESWLAVITWTFLFLTAGGGLAVHFSKISKKPWTNIHLILGILTVVFGLSTTISLLA